MFEEPYRWVEAVSNRREYLDEQLKAGSPVLALPCREGIFLLSASSGTQKVYEIYDRIAMGAIGHPADVERLRNVILDMAHVEGFNRSPSDVTARRLIQFGLAPMVKTAFEEIAHAPFIIRLLIAELGPADAPVLYTLNYDGVFKEEHRALLLAPNEEAAERSAALMKTLSKKANQPMAELFEEAFKAWGLAECEADKLEAHLKETLKERRIEAVLLSSAIPGPSKYHELSKDEIADLTQAWSGD